MKNTKTYYHKDIYDFLLYTFNVNIHTLHSIVLPALLFPLTFFVFSDIVLSVPNVSAVRTFPAKKPLGTSKKRQKRKVKMPYRLLQSTVLGIYCYNTSKVK